jgi:hypothetical protein
VRILRSSQPTRQHKVAVPVDWVVSLHVGRDVDGQHLRTLGFVLVLGLGPLAEGPR